MSLLQPETCSTCDANVPCSVHRNTAWQKAVAHNEDLFTPGHIYIRKARGTIVAVWQIPCPICRFVFERTKKDIALFWAEDHNMELHNGELEIEFV